MALLAFVLFAAFLFEDDDLIGFAVLNDLRFDRARSDDAAREKSLDIDLLSSLGTDLRHTKRHSALDRILLATCSNNCVTHVLAPLVDTAKKLFTSRKTQIIRKLIAKVKGKNAEIYKKIGRVL